MTRTVRSLLEFIRVEKAEIAWPGELAYRSVAGGKTFGKYRPRERKWM
jgi:hypothetical protein